MKTILLFLFSFSTITMWTQIIVPVPENKNSAEPKPSKALERSSEDVDFVEKKKIATEFNAANSQQLNYNQAYAYFNQKWNQFSRNPNRRTFSANEQQELQIYLGRMTQLEEKNPRSLLSYYLAGQHNTERYEALRLAEKSLPNDADVLKQLVAFNEIVGKFENERELLVRIFRLSIYPKTNIDYAQDVLASVANGGILVVHGWEDFLAIRYAQLTQNYRKDVLVISLDFLNSENYRKSLKQKGIFIPSQIEVNPSFVREFCLKNEQKNVQLSMTIAAPYFQIISQSIYVKGLTFYFSSILQDLYTENLILWEKGLAKQSLKVTGFTLNSNYLPILYQLRSGSVSSSSYGKKLPNEPYSEIINRIVDQLKLSENSKNY